MIKSYVRGNVFGTQLRHIAFAVNIEGYNDSGFAGQVSSKHWEELANTGKKKLGETMSKNANGKTFHALVCHSLQAGGWEKTPEFVQKCLDQLEVPDNEPIAVVLMGSGLIGQLGGADVDAILEGIRNSKKIVVVYTL